ncbi:unnamed protein product [Adineta steineri]|uniref:Superoxide dismutase copper/zinc binding domain-containing protein n=1 Tax=Adineta steineri TaxID=433720 RepID=A0A818TRU0_9BILA|nr:unnamed protein product [Adineta steineri]
MFVLLISILLLLFIDHRQCSMIAYASVKLHNTSQSIGILTFFQSDANSPVKVSGTLNSLNASQSLGFHVHTLGVSNNMPNCIAAADHFNPYNTSHGPRESDIWHRHVGDLGNITTSANGVSVIDIEDSIIQLYNATQSINNRTIVIHITFDDGGVGSNDSNLTGHAGAQVACGIIKLDNIFSKMVNDYDDNFDDIDLDEVFNDFNEKQLYIPRQPLIKWGLSSNTNQDDLTEFDENDCTAPRISRKRPKNRKKNNTKQMTMYDYASSISYRHKQFYSSLDNTTTTKTIIKGEKRPLTEYQQLALVSKKLKTDNNNNKLSSSTPPDLVDNLLRYLDERSRPTTEHFTHEYEKSVNDEMKRKKNKNSVL